MMHVIYACNIRNGKNLKIKPIDSSLKDKYMVYCSVLPFGIISFSCYINIKTMNNISSVIEINKDKPLVDDLDHRPLIYYLKCINDHWKKKSVKNIILF